MPQQGTKQRGDTIANRLAKTRIVKELLDQEDVPLTDEELAAELRQRGYRCGLDRARAYRRSLGIAHYTDRAALYIERLKGK